MESAKIEAVPATQKSADNSENSIIVCNVPYGIPLTDNSLESYFNRKSNGGNGGIVFLEYLDPPTEQHSGIAKIVFDNEETAKSVSAKRHQIADHELTIFQGDESEDIFEGPLRIKAIKLIALQRRGVDFAQLAGENVRYYRAVDGSYMVEGRFCEIVMLEMMIKSLLDKQTMGENFTAVNKQKEKPLGDVDEQNGTTNQIEDGPSVFPKQPAQGSDDRLIAHVVSGNATLIIQPTKDTTIRVHQADITKLHVDAIVNAANSMLQHGGGVALEIATAAGIDALRQACDDIVQTNGGRLKVSTVVATKGFKLPAKQVLHVVAPAFHKDCKGDEKLAFEYLYQAYASIFELVNQQRIRSLAIPGISAGSYLVPPEISARAVASLIERLHAEQALPIIDVHFVDKKQSMIQAFAVELLKVARSSGFKVSIESVEQTLAEMQTVKQEYLTENDSNGWHLVNEKESIESKRVDGGTSNSCCEDRICNICLDDDKPITTENSTKLDKCGHTFHRNCIDESFKNCSPQCPVCKASYGEKRGNQPAGTMTVSKAYGYIPGFEKQSDSTIIICYDIPNGNQDNRHPHPGRYYSGTSREAYLPATKQGIEIAHMLVIAFKRGLVFTVGHSHTTGADDTTIWNDIHHKTSKFGGPQNYGYPDDTYLARVTAELRENGIDHSSINTDDILFITHFYDGS